MIPYALYLHIPFCVHRCAYCDFNTYAGQQALIPAYVDALCAEIEYTGRRLPSPGSGMEGNTATSIFIGGGTPSLVSVLEYEKILHAITTWFKLSDPEISIEVNPGTVNEEYLRGLVSLGFNRISIGMQSSHSDELHQMGRIHDFYAVIDAVRCAHRVGLDNLNLDLIFGLPGQEMEKWSTSVRRAVMLQPRHLSLYALTIEAGTPFDRWYRRGLLPDPDPDLAADMYEWAGEYLEKQGYKQYEISNWAQDVGVGDPCKIPAFACRHNLTYWRGLPYLGFGAGAHGYANGIRAANVSKIRTYLQRIQVGMEAKDSFEFPVSPATASHQRLSTRTAMQETMMTGLRLTSEGVSDLVFTRRFGVPMRKVFGGEINELLALGLLQWEGSVLRLTKRGRLLGNQVFMRFVD